jgi:hypothetical protein
MTGGSYYSFEKTEQIAEGKLGWNEECAHGQRHGHYSHIKKNLKEQRQAASQKERVIAVAGNH